MIIMQISSVHSATNFSVQPQSAITHAKEIENDGDKDDAAQNAVTAQSAPTVNTSGQSIGNIINIQA
ncbi:MAG: hypothetical protein A2522_06510 [Gallionellales bacterium RIFOXYD12_FULL_53_10]|nr:MAG: hypothetical protein A2522_06510 [Gallionellales bacterium RIFOXYD12_FULL_53_10]OGT22821.1 MAG: hypothetical protein A3K00_04140 [Gallionellales bacterium RIFOXYD2_FULL_52_7]